MSLQTKENEHGSDSNLEFEKEDTYKCYTDFFYDVVSELEKCGKIRNFFACCNHESHLRGNVYIEYNSTRDALVSYHKFNGRWYDGKQLNVYFCNIENWKNAICGLYFRNKCPKGNSCNFLHVFKNPKNLYSNYEDDFYRRSNRTSSRSNKTVQEWDMEIPDRRHLRWSESPERILEKEETLNNIDKSRKYVNDSEVTKSRHREHKEKRRHRPRDRSRSRSRSNHRRKRSSSRRRREFTEP
ncbi:hypothetical protein GWI33_020278 [Rhynchophorus ferrugineus]|uniref:C3H1-type domain-containing protein n=1 Tax=Rhynchophorus ferrugineus TaxID=354439 RepID=A0A834HRW1_RHYFE|nr:hypothetical protein GWI33_020278 [Rhynchophorus ferrugineus]